MSCRFFPHIRSVLRNLPTHPQLQRLLRKQVEESRKRLGPTAIHRQVVNDFGINCSLSVVKRVLGELQASSNDLLVEGFQTLPAALDFLRESMGAYTAFETDPLDEHGRRRFLRAFVSLKESRVRQVGRAMVVVDVPALTHAHTGTHDVQAVASLCRTICFEDSCHHKSIRNLKGWFLST